MKFDKKISDLKSCFKFSLSSQVISPYEELLNFFFIEGVIRQINGKLLITVAVVNRHPSESSSSATRRKIQNQKSLFQTQLRISTANKTNPAILPYPEPINNHMDKDELSNRLYIEAPLFLLVAMGLHVIGIVSLILQLPL